MIIGAETNLISVLVVTSVVAGHKWAESLMLMSQFMERGLVRTTAFFQESGPSVSSIPDKLRWRPGATNVSVQGRHSWGTARVALSGIFWYCSIIRKAGAARCLCEQLCTRVYTPLYVLDFYLPEQEVTTLAAAPACCRARKGEC